VNQLDGESILQLFRERGWEPVAPGEQADVCLVNTCTVTHLADRKSRQVIRQLARHNPGALIIVSGCYAQRDPQALAALPGVGLIVGNTGHPQLVDMAQELLSRGGDTAAEIRVLPLERLGEWEEMPTALQQGRTRAFLKIQDGCDQWCSYCAVPLVRGPLRSRPLPQVVVEVAAMVAAGYQEVVLTGIHTSAYGRDQQPGVTVVALLAAIVREVPGLLRLRLSSIEALEIPPDLAAVMVANPQICRHLHLPLQSGDDEILRRMGRPYCSGDFARVVAQLRAAVPDLLISTDVIVGFPGETEEHFQRTRDFIEREQFSDLHVFKYSPRPGTLAATFSDQIKPEIKEQRSQELIRLGGECRRNWMRRYLGRQVQVLVEETDSAGVGIGYTDNYLRVAAKLPAGQDWRGRVLAVCLYDCRDDLLLGSCRMSGRTLPDNME